MTYTWMMPGDGECYQLDYILVRKKLRNEIKKAGAEADFDHNLVLMESELCLQREDRLQ